MKLSYRGVSYETESSMPEVTEGEVGGLYRGQAWRVHRPTPSRRRYTALIDLIYRGVAYRRR